MPTVRVRDIMQKFIVILGFISILSSINVHAEPGTFLPGFEDIPLMTGLKPQKNRDFIFDTPSGRIIEETAFGNSSRAQVTQFYDSTLPELGWKKIGSRIFERDGERLNIKCYGQDGDLSVRFTLTPGK